MRGLTIIFLLGLMEATVAFSSRSNVNPQAPTKVLVTGAAGRTGKLVFEKLLIQHNRFDPIALVRSEGSGRKLVRDMHCGLERVVVCDVVNDLSAGSPPEGLEGADTMIICTSAVPVLSKKSLVRTICLAPFNLIRGEKAFNFRSFRFKFKKGQYPEMVDYEGQVAQIDLAKKLGMKKVVIVSSMGGTDPDNFLNKVGKKPDGSGNGDILLWKRKAERYLVESGLGYTIIHPGGLIDADSDVEEIVIGVDDKLMDNAKRSISRSDVASLCVASLTVTEQKNVSIDCTSRVLEKGTSSPKSAEEVLTQFLKTGQTTDYSL